MRHRSRGKRTTRARDDRNCQQKNTRLARNIGIVVFDRDANTPWRTVSSYDRSYPTPASPPSSDPLWLLRF